MLTTLVDSVSCLLKATSPTTSNLIVTRFSESQSLLLRSIIPLIHSKVSSDFPLLPEKKLRALQKPGRSCRTDSTVMPMTSSPTISSHTGLLVFFQHSKHIPAEGHLHWQSPCLEHSFPRFKYD